MKRHIPKFVNLERMFTTSFGGLGTAKLARVIRSGNYIAGNTVKRFEEKWADMCGKAFCVTVNSCTDALELSLYAHDIPKGSKVLVQANSFVATADAVVRAGMIPVFMDCDTRGQPDPLIIAQFLEQDSNIRAVIPVHLYGEYTDLSALYAKFSDICFIEDCAQAHSHKIKAPIACFSFYPTKNLGGMCDGGAVVLDSRKKYEKIMMLRDHGRVDKFTSVIPGVNSRMSEYNATFLLHRLKTLESQNETRKRLAAEYYKRISKYYDTNYSKDSFHHIFMLYSSKRDLLAKQLKDVGISTSIHYRYPIPKQTAYKKYDIYPITNAEARSNIMLSIPFCPYINVLEMDYLFKQIDDIANGIK